MFNLTVSQKERLDKWLEGQNALAIEHQKEVYKQPNAIIAACWEDGFPYTGAIGGCITYHITPTSLGIAIKVTHAITKNEIDLSDYEDW